MAEHSTALNISLLNAFSIKDIKQCSTYKKLYSFCQSSCRYTNYPHIPHHLKSGSNVRRQSTLNANKGMIYSD